MPQFRVPTRTDRYGFDMSIDARITEFKLSNTADLIGNLILSDVDPVEASEFRNSSEVTVILDWIDETELVFAITALISNDSGSCAILEIQAPASQRMLLEMKAALMEEWVDCTVTRLKEFGFTGPRLA